MTGASGGEEDRLGGRRTSLAVLVVLAIGVLAVAIAPDLTRLSIPIGQTSDLIHALRWFVAGGALVAGWGGAYLLWRALGPPQSPQIPDAATAQIRALAEVGTPENIVRQTLPLLWDRSSWIIRRVEQIAFSDRTMVRRRVSVDFRVPEHPFELSLNGGRPLGAEANELLSTWLRAGGEGANVRFLPVSILRAWPPVLNLDLRDRDGKPVPLLSKATTNALDSRLLFAVAEQALGAFVEDIQAHLLTLVYDDGAQAERAFVVVAEAVEHVLDQVPDLDEVLVEQLVDFARLLVYDTLLWVPVTSAEGTREILKLAYDEPVRRQLALVGGVLTGFGLRSVIVGFEIGQIGDAGSYHLEIAAPTPLEVVKAELVTWSERPPARRRERIARRVRAGPDSVRGLLQRLEREIAYALNRNPPRPLVTDRNLSQQVFTRRVHFYASGQRSRPAQASLRLRVDRRGVPLAGAMTGVLVSAGLTGFQALATEIYKNRASAGITGASVAFLLLAPTLISYVLTRANEHPLADRALGGIRLLTITAVLLSVAAAGLLIDAVARADNARLGDILPWLVRSSWAVAGLLLLSFVLPMRRGDRGD